MSQPPRQNQPHPPQLEPDVIKSIVEQQGQKLQLDLQRLKLDEKKLDHNTKLSEKSMVLQAEFLKEQPKEHRKTITRIAYIIGGLIAIFLFFIGFLVYTGNKDFAETFLKVCSYVITSALSFWVGRKSIPSHQNKNNSGSDNIQDAEIID